MLNTNYSNSDFTGIYDTTFLPDFTAIWQGTPFRNELSDMCYVRSGTCFLQSNENSEVDRRRLLYSYLKNIFNTETGKPLDRNKPILKTDNLLVNRVINNICSLYNEEPTRTFEANGKVYVNEDLTKILTKAQLNRTLKQAYKLGKLVNECAVKPYINSKKQLKFQVLTPDLYRTLKNDNGEVIEFWVPFQVYDKFGYVTTKFHVWDALRYTRRDVENRFINFEHEGKKYGIEGYLHGYERIPYAILKLNENEIYSGGLWELILTQLQCNVIDYVSTENLLYGGIGLWYLQNLDLKGNITLNPGDALVAENVGMSEMAEPRVEYVQGGQVYNDIQVYKEIIIKNTLKSLGMPSSMLSDNPGLQSGISMKLDRMELNEYRRDDIDVLQPYEEELINLTINVMNKDLRTGFPNIEVNTDYQEQSIYLEPLQEVEYIQSLYDKGLISPLDYVKRLTGNALIKSNKEAIKFINDNKAYNDTEPDRSTGDGGVDEPLQLETEEQQIQTAPTIGAREEQSIRGTDN